MPNLEIPAAEAASLVKRNVTVQTESGPEERLTPVFAREIFASALRDDHIVVVTIDGQKLIGAHPNTSAAALQPSVPAGSQSAGESDSPAATEAAVAQSLFDALPNNSAALQPSAPAGSQPAGESNSPAATEAAAAQSDGAFGSTDPAGTPVDTGGASDAAEQPTADEAGSKKKGASK